MANSFYRVRDRRGKKKVSALKGDRALPPLPGNQDPSQTKASIRSLMNIACIECCDFYVSSTEATKAEKRQTTVHRKSS